MLLIRVCCLLLFAGGCVYAAAVIAVADTPAYARNPNFTHEAGMVKLSKKKSAAIVFLGNSITHGANWNELLGRDDVAERGVPSDILPGFIARLPQVIALSPKVCFIKGGINDIYNWVPVDTIAANYRKLVTALRASGIMVVIQSTLLVSKKWHNAENRNAEVAKLNARLKAMAAELKLEYIDLNARMASGGFLLDACTTDGVHLTPAGYRLWRDAVELVIKKYGW